MRINNVNCQLKMVKVEELNELLYLDIYEKSFIFSFTRSILNAIRIKQNEDNIVINEVALTLSDKIIVDSIEKYDVMYIEEGELKRALIRALADDQKSIAKGIYNIIKSKFRGSKKKLYNDYDKDLADYICMNSNYYYSDENVDDFNVLLYKDGRVVNINAEGYNPSKSLTYSDR